MRNRTGRVPFARFFMRVTIFEIRRAKTMPLTIFVHLPKEHLRLTFPGELREFVDGGDQQGWQEAIDLFIDYQHRQAFFACLFTAESTLSVDIATVHQGASTPLFIRFDQNIFTGCYCLTAPGTMR